MLVVVLCVVGCVHSLDRIALGVLIGISHCLFTACIPKHCL